MVFEKFDHPIQGTLVSMKYLGPIVVIGRRKPDLSHKSVIRVMQGSVRFEYFLVGVDQRLKRKQRSDMQDIAEDQQPSQGGFHPKFAGKAFDDDQGE